MELASLTRGIRLLLLSVVGIAALAHAQACALSGDVSSFVDDDAGRSLDRRDAFAPNEDGGASFGTVRLAHLAPDLGRIDFCYAAHSSSFDGPILHGGGSVADAAAPDANANADAAADAADTLPDASDADAAAIAGMVYGAVTKYFTLHATGTITVAIVRAGVTSCANPIARGTVTLDPGKLSTIALFGSASVQADAGDSGGPALVAFIDDRTTKPDRARVRMIHAAKAEALTVRAESTAIAERLEPRKTASPAQSIPVDELGFATIAPVAPPAALAVARLPLDPLDASFWQSAPMDLDLRGDSLHTGFVLDGPDAGFEVLWCADRTTTAELTACIRVR
jgi:hypothetical protein